MRATRKRVWYSTMNSDSVRRVDAPLSHQGLRMQTATTSLRFGVPFYKIIILVLYVTLFFHSVQPATSDEGNMFWTKFWEPPADGASTYPPVRSSHMSGVNGDDFVVFGGNHGDHSTVSKLSLRSYILRCV